MNRHWYCLVRKALGQILWIAAALSLISAWTVMRTKALVLGLPDLVWYWNALVLGVLAAGIKLDGDCSCNVCEPEEKN